MVDHEEFVAWDVENRIRQAQDYDRRHRVIGEKPLIPGTRVFIPDKEQEGIVERSREAPRSVEVETNQGGVVRRNESMLRPLQPDKSQTEVESPVADRSLSRYGREYKKPERYEPYKGRCGDIGVLRRLRR